MAEKKRRGGGGKLARTENVQVRLDPKLRFAAELAAGKERRTLSSFIEWAIERAVKDISVTLDEKDNPVSAANVTEDIWDVDEADRFINLAWNYSELLTHSEQRKWKFIVDTKEFWQTTKIVEFYKDTLSQKYSIFWLSPILKDGEWDFNLNNSTLDRLDFNRPLLRAAWGLIERHISGGEFFDIDAFHALLEKHPPSGLPDFVAFNQPTIQDFGRNRYLRRKKGDSGLESQTQPKDEGEGHGA